jgi:hypothetical protein
MTRPLSSLVDNDANVRKVLAVALSLAVQAAGLSAPVVHAHPDEHATAHHSGRAVHSHWGGHAHSQHQSDAPAVGASERDRAVFLDAFVAVAVSAFPAPALMAAMNELPIPAERSAHRTIEITHGHDPPSLRSLSSRAPPALLA